MPTPVVQGWARTLAQIPGGHALYQQDDLPSPAIGWLDTVRIWIARSRQRKALGELAQLNDYLLQDIGVSRDKALREAAKPFWQR